MYEGFLGNILNIYISLSKLLFEPDIYSAITFFIPCAFYIITQIGGIYGLVKYIYLFKECFEFRATIKDVKEVTNQEQFQLSTTERAKLEYLKSKFCSEIDKTLEHLKEQKTQDEIVLYNVYSDIKTSVKNIPSLEEFEYFKWYYNKGELRSDEEISAKKSVLERKIYKRKYGYTYVFEAEQYKSEKIRAGLYLSLFITSIISLVLFANNYGWKMGRDISEGIFFFWYAAIYTVVGLPLYALILGVTTLIGYIAQKKVKKAYEDIGEKAPVDISLISTGFTAAIAAIAPLIMFKRKK